MAEDEVTDLTEEEAPSEESGKKKKKEKAPKEKKEKEPKEPKEKKEKEPKEPKSPREKKEGGSNLGIVLVLLAVAVLLIGSVAVALVFDVFSSRAIMADIVRDPLVSFIVWLDPRFNMIDDELREMALARENELNEREAQLAEREESYLQRENQMNTRETQLDRRETELNNFDEELTELYERIVPIYRKDMSAQELEDMISYSTTFTRMSPQEAAEILYRIHTTEDVASILYYMNERNAASIMAAFHPDFAAEVTNIWIYN